MTRNESMWVALSQNNIHTGRGAPHNKHMQIMEHTAINGSIHTGCKQHQRVCVQICVQICLCVLCEWGLRLCFGPPSGFDSQTQARSSSRFFCFRGLREAQTKHTKFPFGRGDLLRTKHFHPGHKGSPRQMQSEPNVVQWW